MIFWNVVLTVTDLENSWLQTILYLIYYNLEIKLCYKYWESSLTQIDMKKKWKVILTWEFGRETSFSANLIPSRNILKWKNQDVLKCQDVNYHKTLSGRPQNVPTKSPCFMFDFFLAKTDQVPVENVLKTTWKGL